MHTHNTAHVWPEILQSVYEEHILKWGQKQVYKHRQDSSCACVLKLISIWQSLEPFTAEQHSPVGCRWVWGLYEYLDGLGQTEVTGGSACSGAERLWDGRRLLAHLGPTAMLEGSNEEATELRDITTSPSLRSSPRPSFSCKHTHTHNRSTCIALTHPTSAVLSSAQYRPNLLAITFDQNITVIQNSRKLNWSELIWAHLQPPLRRLQTECVHEECWVH